LALREILEKLSAQPNYFTLLLKLSLFEGIVTRLGEPPKAVWEATHERFFIGPLLRRINQRH
jgi:hypothetical protein